MQRLAIQRGMSSTLFLTLVACAAVFVWVSSQALPEVVASHFGASGSANGFMPRGFYVKFMLGFVVALPLILVWVPNFTFRHSRIRINLPHREYWLAPERRADTIEFLCRHSVRMGALLVVFLSYVHWLVVRANAVVPTNLSSSWFIGGLVAFVGCTVVWAWMLFGRFCNVPR